MGPMSTVELLKDYRILCKLAKAIPSPPIREETLKEIRKLFREYYEKNQVCLLEEESVPFHMVVQVGAT